MFHHGFAFAWPGKGNIEDIAHPRFGSIGHHDDPVREKQRLVHVVRYHERGDVVSLPEIHERLL